jgi:hypothetical protein
MSATVISIRRDTQSLQVAGLELDIANAHFKALAARQTFDNFFQHERAVGSAEEAYLAAHERFCALLKDATGIDADEILRRLS